MAPEQFAGSEGIPTPGFSLSAFRIRIVYTLNLRTYVLNCLFAGKCFKVIFYNSQSNALSVCIMLTHLKKKNTLRFGKTERLIHTSGKIFTIGFSVFFVDCHWIFVCTVYAVCNLLFPKFFEGSDFSGNFSFPQFDCRCSDAVHYACIVWCGQSMVCHARCGDFCSTRNSSTDVSFYKTKSEIYRRIFTEKRIYHRLHG